MTGAPEQGRLIPAALRPTDYAEQALLGGALLRPTQLRNLRWITPQDFSNPARAWLWNTLHRMPADQVSPMAVTTAARSADAGTQRLLSRTTSPASWTPARTRAARRCTGMVLESSLHRLVDSIGSELCTRAAHGSPTRSATWSPTPSAAAASCPAWRSGGPLCRRPSARCWIPPPTAPRTPRPRWCGPGPTRPPNTPPSPPCWSGLSRWRRSAGGCTLRTSPTR
ncbi:hypothetical protein ACFQ0M_48470 [Kitasatospora aburaviensis]